MFHCAMYDKNQAIKLGLGSSVHAAGDSGTDTVHKAVSPDRPDMIRSLVR